MHSFCSARRSLLTDPVYLPLIAATAALFSLFTGLVSRILKVDTVQKMVDVIDAVGIPIFAVIGMQLAEAQGIPVGGVMFVGVVNGTAGGLLRDVIVREVPAILRPGQFVTLLLVLSCGLFLVLKRYTEISASDAAWTTACSFFVLRVLAIRFNWTTRPVMLGSHTGEPGA